MILKKFYEEVVSSEEVAYEFLRKLTILNNDPPTYKCLSCGYEMMEDTRPGITDARGVSLRCSKKFCGKSVYLKDGKYFAALRRICAILKRDISLCFLLELIFLFAEGVPECLAVRLIGMNDYFWQRELVRQIFQICRDICSRVVSLETVGPQIGTLNQPIEVSNLMPVWEGSSTSDGKGGHWILGFRWKTDYRMFHLKDKRFETILEIIKKECQPNSVIVANEREVFEELSDHGYRYFTKDQYDDETKDEPMSATVDLNWMKYSLNLANIVTEDFQSRLDYASWNNSLDADEDKFKKLLIEMYCLL